MSTLAEIIAEAHRLDDEWIETGLLTGGRVGLDNVIRAFYRKHGPRLLAVAEAAVEMREATKFYFGRHSIESDADGGSVRLANATAAFDAAVRGAK